MLSSIASAINTQHGRGGNDVSAYEAVYGQKMGHDFSCLKEEGHQCWMVPEQLKLTNNPKFTEYACKNYIVDNDKICDDDAKGYFLDGLLLSDNNEELSDDYFFDHLQDDISEESHGEGKGYNTFNEFDAEGNNDFVDPVCDVLAKSGVEGPKKSIMMPLSKKQVMKITSSDVPMYMRKSAPKTLIDQSTTQNILLMLPNTNLSTTLVESSAKKNVDGQLSESSEEESEEQKILSKKPKTTKTLEALSTKIAFGLQLSSSSEESETDSQFNAKYEANMRALGHALCNWQFEKFYLSNCPAMRCQFKDGCSNFAHKRCSIPWSRI